MTKVLITGATGNVGSEVIKSLNLIEHQLDIYVGVRNPKEDRNKFSDYNIKFKRFDFTDFKSYSTALEGIDILFLLRPPQIAEVEKYFKPIINICIFKGVKHIVFLSVQGVEKSQIIPHHKIEKLIVDSNIPYTFLRPAYFMQNFTGTLLDDLTNKKKIYLPAGRTKFTLIDVRDIGAVSALILANSSSHINKSYELTSKQKLTFSEMAEILSNILGTEIVYRSPNLFSFFVSKRKENTPIAFILVMIMLHYFPRFQSEPETSDSIEDLLHRQPTTFEQFVKDNIKILTIHHAIKKRAGKKYDN